MYGEWLRVTPAEPEHAMADPSWGHQFARDTDEREYHTEGISIGLAERALFGKSGREGCRSSRQGGEGDPSSCPGVG
jgi:hypothetical protein